MLGKFDSRTSGVYENSGENSDARAKLRRGQRPSDVAIRGIFANTITPKLDRLSISTPISRNSVHPSSTCFVADDLRRLYGF